jgi:hypothetical protein
MVLDKALSDRLDKKAEGADEVEYNGKRYVRSGPKNSASEPGPWREATYTKGAIKESTQALDKGKLISRDQFEEEQDPSWHATLVNGGYSVYLKANKPIAVFSRKDGQGYILQPGEWTGSSMDLVDAFKALLVNESSIGSLLKYMQPLQENLAISSFEQLEQLMEALKGSRVNCFIVTPKDVPELKDDVFAIKNESEVVDFLVTLLGIPRDGTSYKIRTGFMAYDEPHKVLFFSKNKYDLPAYLGKRPVK